MEPGIPKRQKHHPDLLGPVCAYLTTLLGVSQDMQCHIAEAWGLRGGVTIIQPPLPKKASISLLESLSGRPTSRYRSLEIPFLSDPAQPGEGIRVGLASRMVSTGILRQVMQRTEDSWSLGVSCGHSEHGAKALSVAGFCCLVTQSSDSFTTPWTVACQAPLSVGFSRQKCWSGLPFPSPRDLPDPGNESSSPALQADSLSEPRGNRLP